jgi:hypothetical protein
MAKGSSSREHDLRRKLEEARKLIDDAIVLMSGIDASARRTKDTGAKKADSGTTLDFSMSDRAFVKANTKGMSGPKKLVMLVAYLAKGQETARVPVTDITAAWARMTGILGMKFNPAHVSRARDNDWIDTEKTGVYLLRPSWKRVLE